MKPITIKAKNQQEANFFVDTFEKINLFSSSFLCYRCDRDYFTIDCDRVFFSKKGIGNKSIILSSWRSFVLQYLFDKYVVCPLSKDREFLVDFYKLEKFHIGYSNITYFHFNNPNGFWGEHCSYRKKLTRISFDKVKTLLTSITDHETMKKDYTKKIGNVEISAQEAAFLCTMINRSSIVQSALEKEGSEFMFDFYAENGTELWRKFNTLLRDNNYLNKDVACSS